MSSPSNVGSYINYFRDLAVRHKDLQHNPDSETGDAPIGSQRFTKISVDEVLTGLRSKVRFPCLCLELYETETESTIVYDVKQKPKGAFMIIDHPERDTFAAEENCYILCEQILYQILQQIWQDHYRQGVNRCLTPFKEFDFDKITVTPVGPIFNKEFGYRVEFDFELQNTIDLTAPLEEGTFL